MENEAIKLTQEQFDRMFIAIRKAEIENVNTQKFDDKEMAKKIAKYLMKKAEESNEI